MMNEMNEIVEQIQKASKIAILPHVDPDGDCLGSSFAVSLALQKTGKKVQVILENDRPEMFHFLPGSYINYEAAEANDDYDTVICLDSGDLKRLGKRYVIFEKGSVTVNIDHHATNTRYAQYNYVDVNAAATGEIVYQFIHQLRIPICHDIATNLYVAISTDTGGFKYSNTTAKTHAVIAELMETGIPIADINRKIFDTMSLVKLKLTAAAIERIQFYHEGLICVIVLPNDLLCDLGVTEDDTEGLTGLAKSVQGVEVGVLIKEKEPGVIKVSFRSNEYIDVANIAASLGGGGHKRASGCTLNMNLDEAVDVVLKKLEEAFK